MQTAMQKTKDKVMNGGGVLTINDLVEKSAKELGRALPSHMKPDRIVRIALTTLRTNPALYKCNPQSFLAALFQCAQLGLEPNIEGQAYIIPYNVKGQMVAQFQIGYKGYIELFWRHQNAVSLNAEKVCANDHFEYDLGTGEISHKLPGFGVDDERGEVVAYYAVAHLANGGRASKVMSKREVLDFGKRFTKCYDRTKDAFMSGTPWANHFDAMALKTVLKQLMKLLPKSIEIQKAVAMDETIKTAVQPDMFEVPDTSDHEDLETTAVAAPDLTEEEKKEILKKESAGEL